MIPRRRRLVLLSTTLAGAGMLVAAGAHAHPRLRGVTSNLLAAGNSHAFVIEIGTSPFPSSAYGWGTRASAELGNKSKSTTAQTSPVTVGLWSQLAAGTAFSVGIDQFGKLWGWGKTDQGQSGVSKSATPVSTPGQIDKTSSWRAVAAGANHACAITSAGALYCWGDNSMGELGASGASRATIGAAIAPNTTPWLAVACGAQFTVALQADGTAWAWGSNSTAGKVSGQLGTGDKTDLQVTTPTKIGAAHWIAISAGTSHVLGVQDDGSLWAWGSNADDQLGNATNAFQQAPGEITAASLSPAASGPWVAVAAGGEHSLAIRADGTLWGWGENRLGQVGCVAGKSAGQCASPQPTPFQIGSNYQYVVAGFDFSLGVTASGDLWAWGNNASGQLATPAVSGSSATTGPVRVPDTATGSFAAIKPAVLTGGGGTTTDYQGSSAAHIKTSGVLETWGTEISTAIPNGSYTLGLASGQPGTTDQLGVFCYALGFCGLGAPCGSDADCNDGTGQGCTWGDNACWGPMPVVYQQVGSTYSTNLLPWLTVAAGQSQMLAIRADGTLWAWGQNSSGEVGNGKKGTNNQAQLPVQVGAGLPWVKVFAEESASNTMAIRSDGTLWGWGARTGSATPLQLCTSGACAGHRWATAALGQTPLAVSTDGKLWSFTSATQATQLTNTNSASSWGTLAWLDVQTSELTQSATDAAGNLWGWGYSIYGSIGGGEGSEPPAILPGEAGMAYPPNQSGGTCPACAPQIVLSNVSTAVRCDLSALALDATSSLWLWGQDEMGEVGSGVAGDVPTGDNDTGIVWVTNGQTGLPWSSHAPTGSPYDSRISTSALGWTNLITPVQSLVCGGFTTFLADGDGMVWTVGSNQNGQAGTGQPAKKPGGVRTPVRQGFVYPALSAPPFASASVNSGSAFGINDGSDYWASGTNQASGMWFEINMGFGMDQWPLFFTGVKLVSHGANDYPHAYVVEISTNESTWTQVASGVGRGQYLSITFPMQSAEYLRVRLTQAASVPWDISYFEVMY